jgi:hypothetical protein
VIEETAAGLHSTADPAGTDFFQLLTAFPKQDLLGIAASLTRRSCELGLQEWHPESSTRVPLSLTPEIITPDSYARRASDAHTILSLVQRTALRRFELLPRDRAFFVIAALGPLDRKILDVVQAPTDVTIARVD